ncbi:hypothetical protein [Alkalimarinus coralli]|uniref:hypothetical protein n=1 Tax=Alkalimarinus coralli TaxID=2935863 RepID=UPI00202B92FD|nr:hypothetical protein [Alkalimarinus coralli]
MFTAYYMEFTKGRNGSKSFVGGQPEKLPSVFPWPENENSEWGFLLELEVDGKRIDLPNVSAIQLWGTIDDGDDPSPVALIINKSSPERVGDVPVHPYAIEHDINFIEKPDPSEYPEGATKVEQGKLFKSKVGGLNPWSKEGSGQLLFQIHEMPVLFNFAGRVASAFLAPNGEISVELN